MGVKNPVMRLPQLAEFPSAPATGQRVFHTGQNNEYLFDGSAWKTTTQRVTGETDLFACPSTVSIGDIVTLTTADSVDRAIANSDSLSKVIGIAFSKPTTTSCEIVRSGRVEQYTGLTVGDVYWLSDSSAGTVTNTPPSAAGSWQVKIGHAESATTIGVQIEVKVRL
jgi:hypothetical protein